MRGYAAIGLTNPKTSANVGGVMRAAGIYGAAMVVLAGQRFRRWPTDTRQAWRHMPLVEAESLRDHIPFSCVPVAVELIDGARPLPTYQHPERAFYVFGPEDSSLGRETLAWCRDVIYVPGNGCMNLAATVNVILYDRLCKSKASAEWQRFSKVAA